MSVAGPQWNMMESTTKAARSIGLAEEDFWNILDAADNATGGNRNEKVVPLRKQLLEACGLKEE